VPIPRPSSRRRLRRRPAPWWTGALLLAALTGLVVARAAGEAAAERERWGATVAVAVATADAGPGEPVAAEVRHVPRSLVPEGAVTTVAGAVAATGLHAGEIVLASRLAPAGTSPVAALLPVGHRGVAVPAGDGLPVAVGDLVDVLVTLDPESARPTFAVASAVPVVHVGEAAVTVAVPAGDAPRVAFAVVAGAVTLALSGWR
jgi:Flp pilus assembly protein CpaB